MRNGFTSIVLFLPRHLGRHVYEVILGSNATKNLHTLCFITPRYDRYR